MARILVVDDCRDSLVVVGRHLSSRRHEVELLENAEAALEQIRVSQPLIPIQENVILGNAPLFHILGQTTSLSTLLVGGALLVQPRINLDATFEAIQRFKVRSMVQVWPWVRSFGEDVEILSPPT